MWLLSAVHSLTHIRKAVEMAVAPVAGAGGNPSMTLCLAANRDGWGVNSSIFGKKIDYHRDWTAYPQLVGWTACSVRVD
jgi:hypothetical protein